MNYLYNLNYLSKIIQRKNIDCETPDTTRAPFLKARAIS